MNPISKSSNIRINHNTKAWAELDNAVRDRDCDRCACCHLFVPEYFPLHHEPPKGMGGGGHGEDVLEKMCVLCPDCHHERHHGKFGQAVRVKTVVYLRDKANETD